MAYTRAWSVLTPAGSDAASTIDDAIRNVRVDLAERMNTLIGGSNWSNDPVVTLTGYTVTFPHFLCITDATTNSMAADNANAYVYKPAAGGSLNVFMPLPLPVGITITKVESIVMCITGSTLTSGFLRRIAQTSTSSATTMGNAVVVTPDIGTWQLIDQGVSSYTVLTGDTFGIEFLLGPVTTNTNVRVRGVKVTYTRPSLAQGY